LACFRPCASRNRLLSNPSAKGPDPVRGLLVITAFTPRLLWFRQAFRLACLGGRVFWFGVSFPFLTLIRVFVQARVQQPGWQCHLRSSITIVTTSSTRRCFRVFRHLPAFNLRPPVGRCP